MKKIILSIILIFSVVAGNYAYSQQNRLFPYPTISDESMTLRERCNYMVYNFWERCNIKQSFSSLDRLNESFGVWASFMPYASADTVHLSIDNYIKAVNKQAPKEMPEVAKMAQNWFQCDTAQYFSEELYLPFCKAMIDSKKVTKAQKAPYEAQYKILTSSGVGMIVPSVTLTTPDGDKIELADVLASRIILFFNDPDCLDCRFAKTRMASDFNLNQLIQDGLVKVVSIYPGDYSEQWANEAKTYPDNWIVGASPDIYEYFDITVPPVIYLIDGRHMVLAKNIDIDTLLYHMAQIYTLQKNTNAAPINEETETNIQVQE